MSLATIRLWRSYSTSDFHAKGPWFTPRQSHQLLLYIELRPVGPLRAAPAKNNIYSTFFRGSGRKEKTRSPVRQGQIRKRREKRNEKKKRNGVENMFLTFAREFS